MYGNSRLNFTKMLKCIPLQQFSKYLSYGKDSNELLLFLLKQMAQEQASYLQSRYRAAQEIVTIPEVDFKYRVKLFI